jgi:dephospho-CoA kinase/inosine/xanthosine triphosphate pyrophosphatase family protein
LLELVFITSSTEKLVHAKHLCSGYAILISKQKNYGIGYVEPRLENRDELISESVEDALKRFSKTVSNPENKYFFIEDTSVIINGLSKHKEYPGVDIKYWMRENDFSSVDTMLKCIGNDRRVEVRSDVVLVLPKELQDKFGVKYKVFTSSTQGTITETEYNIRTQPLYPWLSSKTFNKWFVPIGAEVPLSLLPIHEADKYDFRRGAFKQMLDFLRANARIKTIEEYNKDGAQLKLFEPYCFVVCGPSCSGKSTLADHLTQKYNYYHIEASDYMHLSFYNRHGVSSGIKIADFAEQALKENSSIVADQIVKDINKLKLTPVIVTGFRSPLEIEYLVRNYNGGLYIQSVFVDADQEERHKRSLKRDRHDAQKTLEEFKARDEQQGNMGLSLIRNEHKGSVIFNNGTFQEYYDKFENKFEKQLNAIEKTAKIFIPRTFTARKLQNAIISTMANQADPSEYKTTAQIAKLIQDNPGYQGRPKHKDNISRYFHQNYHPFFEIELSGGKTHYRLSQTGKAYALWLSRNKRSE